MSSRPLLISRSRFPSAALVTAVCGCLASSGQLPPRLAAPAVAVEHDTYRVRRVRDGEVLELTIVATYTNRTADTIVVHPCYERRQAVALEKWVDGEWKSAFGQACPDILDRGAPRLAPGASRTDTSLIFATLRPNTEPRFELATVPGLYRMVYWGVHGPARADGRLGALLPKEQRVSNPFRVVE